MHITIVTAIFSNAKRMPDDVRAAVETILQTHGAMTKDTAERFLLSLERSGRWQVEAWS